MTGGVLGPDDVRAIHESLPHGDAAGVKALAAALERFGAASDKTAEAAQIALELAPLGVRGLSAKSLYRKLAAYRRRGWAALCDGRALRSNAGEDGNAGPATRREFTEWWAQQVTANQRKCAPAYRRLFDRLAAGESIPGYGTWADIWRAERGGTPPDTCPYRAYACTPRGWSYPTLMRLRPDAFGMEAARIGLGGASAYLPDVPRTRVGLLRCQCVQIDDMWHNIKVMWDGNRKAERVVQLSMVDVLTGRFFASLCKPVRERDDGTRETLRQEWVKYFVGYLLVIAGYSHKGCLIMGEHGTAAADRELTDALKSLCGDAVRFGAGGLLSQPLAAGLYDGRPRGNPKYKGLIESLHSLEQHQLADARGQIGSRDSLGNEPEQVYGMDKETAGLVAAAVALERTRPGIINRLQMPYMPYRDFSALVDEAFAALNRRGWHRMEGWDGCGFVGGEFRAGAGMPWTPDNAITPESAQAVRAMVAADPSLWRQRNMSPDEAWAARASDVRRLEPWAMPVILGPGLSRECACSDKLELDYRDDSTLRRHTVAGVLDSGETLRRGARYRVWVNPLCVDRAYIADADGRYLGTARAMVASNPDDFEGLKRNLAVRQKALGAEIKRLRPVAVKRLREQAEASRVNCEEILGEDPAEALPPWDDARTDISDLMPQPAGAVSGASLGDFI